MQQASAVVQPSEDDILLAFDDLANRWGVKYQTLMSYERRGEEFPRPVRIPGGSKRWRLSDVLDFEERYGNPTDYMRHRSSTKTREKA